MTFGAVVGAFLFAWIAAGEIYDYQDTVDGANLPGVDAIVCLAGGRGRIAFAGDLWYRYWEQTDPGSPVPTLYLSGMGHQSNWQSLSIQIRRGVMDVLAPKNVILETESTNTEENARWLLDHARRNGWTRILLITSRYHMKRAGMIFNRLLAPEKIRVETLSYYQEPFEPSEWRTDFTGIRVTITEYVKWLVFRLGLKA